MSEIQQINLSNQLLRLFPAEDFERVVSHMEFVDLPRRFAFSQPHEISEFSYFPECGIGSIVASSLEGQSAEIGIFGREGMTPIAAVLGAGQDPYSTFMQVGGNGYRIRNVELVGAVNASDALKTLMGFYAQTQAIQSAYTALSNAVHQIDERLARWILMCHDRTEGNEIPLTHEFLAVMLAVRRPSVTTSLHILEGNRLLRAVRGMVTVRNRSGLEAFARDGYGIPEQEYKRLLGPMGGALRLKQAYC